MDQSYIKHSLPPVSPLSVNKLIQRRLERDFSADDLTGAILLGREKEGRKDWNHLLISAPYSKELKNWADIIAELPNQFAGIYLLPVEAGTILDAFSKPEKKIRSFKKLGKQKEEPKTSAWKVLVIHNKVGGFRQVVFRDGKLLFTRLSQSVGEELPEVIAGNVEQEIMNTLEYLKRLAYSERDGLELYIIISSDVKSVIDPNRLRATKVEIYNPYEASQKLGLDQAALPGDRFGDVLCAAFFGSQNKYQLKLATSYMKKLNMFYLAIKGMRITTYLAAIAVLFTIATTFYALEGTREDITRYRSERNALEVKVRTIQDKAGQLPEDIDEINDLVSIDKLLSENNLEPNDLLIRLAGVLEPGVSLLDFSWEPSNTFLNNPNNLKTVEIVLRIQFIENPGDVETFLQTAEPFVAKFKESFSDYNVQVFDMPRRVEETDSLQLDFSSNHSQSIQGKPLPSGPITIRFTLTGPQAG
jgi:hypothetical protein